MSDKDWFKLIDEAYERGREVGHTEANEILYWKGHADGHQKGYHKGRADEQKMWEAGGPWYTITKKQAYDKGRSDERALHVNDNCVWGEGECIPDCPSCRRMDDLYAERHAGFKEAIRDAISVVDALEDWRHCDDHAFCRMQAAAIAALKNV